MASLLLEAKADKDMAMGGGATPLIVAADFEQLDLARLLLEASANPDKPMRDGQTPLRIAAGHRQWEMAHLLLEAKADKDKAMRAILRSAARQGLREVASLAKADKDKHHLSVPAQLNNRWQALFWAATGSQRIRAPPVCTLQMPAAGGRR